MADVAHKNLTGADLHEPKGADTANDGEVYVADGAGSGDWAPVAISGLVPLAWYDVNPGVTQFLAFENGDSSTVTGGTVVLDGTYDHYMFRGQAITCVTHSDVVPVIQFGTGGGPTYQGANYAWHSSYGNHTGTGFAGNANDNSIRMGGNTVGVGAGSLGVGGSIDFEANLHHPSNTSVYTTVRTDSTFTINGPFFMKNTGAGGWTGGNSITAVRFFLYQASSGAIPAINSGRVTLYGVRGTI